MNREKLENKYYNKSYIHRSWEQKEIVLSMVLAKLRLSSATTLSILKVDTSLRQTVKAGPEGLRLGHCNILLSTLRKRLQAA